MRTNHLDVHSSIPALAVFGVLLFAQPLMAADEAVTTVFGTDVVPTQWLITGAGVEAAPARSTPIHPGFISFTSNGTRDGQFIPGASAAAFDGAWYADYSFALPRRAQNIVIDFFDLGVDDRVVLLFNGSPLGNATISERTGAGQHIFEPGEPSSSFTFTQTTEGSLYGDDNPLFIVGDKDPRGKENVLRLSLNNTGTPYPWSNAIPLGANPDGTVARVRGSVSWTEDYQIRPYPNPQGEVVQVDDDPHGWYNAVSFVNGGAIVVDAGGTLTNRSGAWLDNTGTIQNNGHIILQGQYSSLPYSSLQNFGKLDVAGQVEESGAVVNTGELTVRDGGVFTYAGQGGAMSSVIPVSSITRASSLSVEKMPV
jgi:hypothetical protein